MRPAGRTAGAVRPLLAALLLAPAPAWAQQPDPSGSVPPIQQQWDQQGQNPVPSLNVPVTGEQVLSGQPRSGSLQSGAAPAEDQAQGNNVPGNDVQGDLNLPSPGNQGPATFTAPNVWVPAAGAKVQALDKVNARAKDFSLKVGESATFGSLTITVRACLVRPSDQPADAAAFLDVTDGHPASGNFTGWMLENEPAVSMMQNPIYDVRVDGCT